MLDQVLDLFEITSDYDLRLMSHNQSLNSLGGKTLIEMDDVLEKAKPDLVLVQGDTTTAAMVAVAAFHKSIKVGHVEAGLRTNNKRSPFPEEINRQIISRIADYHFVPTVTAGSNLENEHVPSSQIYLTGNTIVDAIEWARNKMKTAALPEEIIQLKGILHSDRKMILVTGHRRESFGKGIEQVCKALIRLVEEEEVEIVYPVHLNPNIKGPVKDFLGGHQYVHLIEPVSYRALLWLLQQAVLIISDSGGIQEEAPSFQKKVLVTRSVSERMEGVKAGFSLLVGTDPLKIVEEAKQILENPPTFTNLDNPYGDGMASKRIVGNLFGLE